MAVLVDDQNGIDGGRRLFELAQLHVQGLLGGLDLLVGEIVGDGVDGGERQVDGLKHAGRVLRHDAEVRQQLFVGVRERILVADPAGIGKNRHRNGDRGHHHDFQAADGGVAAGAHGAHLKAAVFC